MKKRSFPTSSTIIMFLVVFLFFVAYLIFIYRENFTQKQVKLDRIYYINLDRRKDRKEHFLGQCRKEDIDMRLVQRFIAIDGKTFELKEEEKKLFANCQYKNSPFHKKIMANQLSHYYILLDMIEKGYDHILILQDDVVFKKDFNKHLEKVLGHLPKDAEIVNIGLHQYALFDYFEPLPLEDKEKNKTSCKRPINEAICELTDNVNPCSLAYIVTKKGAHNLVHYFQENGFHNETDWNYNNYMRSKNINYVSTIALCTGALMGSDIFTEEK